MRPPPPGRVLPGSGIRSWADAAREGQVVAIRCNGCHRTQHFLAEDLAKVCGSDRPAHIAPFACGRCGTDEYINVRAYVPRPEECLNLSVRRPVRPVQRWIWRTVPYGS